LNAETGKMSLALIKDGQEFLGLITPVGGISIPLVALRGIVPVMQRLS